MADSSVFSEIKEAIGNLKWGSVEVIVQNGEVTQISTRIIKKTNAQTRNISPKAVKNIKKSDKAGINLNFKY